MNFGKKLFLVLSLAALLVAGLVTTAFAAETRVVKFASVAKVKVLDDQPATFSLLGDYTCDSVDVQASVTGKTIYINAYDVKVKHTGKGCDNDRSYKRTISVGNLVPGTYTILVNVGENGKAAKKIKGFVAPVFATAVPAQP